MIARVAACLLLLVLAGCGLPGNVVLLIPDEDGGVGKATVSNGGKTVALDGAYAGAKINPGEGPSKIDTPSKADVDRTFAATLAATPRPPKVFRVFFANGRSDLDAKARAAVEQAVATARDTPNLDVSVVGHTDALGGGDENLALSLRRANSVRDALIADGVAATVIAVDYFGPNDPVVPNKPGVPEPLNRRVEVTVR